MTLASDESQDPRLELRLGTVSEITLARPLKANALDWETGERFRAAVAAVSAHAEARVLLIRGRGAHFCAGGDFDFIAATAELPQEQVAARMHRFYSAFLCLLQVPVPTVAVVQGSAIGAGLCLALACDVRIGSLDARLGLGFARLGLHPGMGATALVPRLAPGWASDLLLTGEIVRGAEAAKRGLLSRAVENAELEAGAQHAVNRLRSAAPAAIRQTVATLRAPILKDLEQALEREAREQSKSFASPELREAIAAFRARRKPSF